VTNYSESSAATNHDTYRRVRYIGIWNPATGTPRFQILEADAAFIGGKKVHIDENVGGIQSVVPITSMSEMSEPIQVRDMASDELIDGEFITRQKLMQYFYSWARHEQIKRDSGD
jgi:hypothetical protein